jgi:predicted ester cyclase
VVSQVSNKDLARSYLEEVFGKGNSNKADQILASDCKLKSADGSTVMLNGLESMKKLIELMHGALTNMQVRIHDQIEEGDKVVTCWSVAGVYDKEIMKMVPNNKRMVAQGISVTTISDGMIREISQSFERSFEPVGEVEFNIHRWLWLS